jgi:hypothetical protein
MARAFSKDPRAKNSKRHIGEKTFDVIEKKKVGAKINPDAKSTITTIDTRTERLAFVFVRLLGWR